MTTKISLFIMLTLTAMACNTQPRNISYNQAYNLEQLDWGLDAAAFYANSEDEGIAVYPEELAVRTDSWDDKIIGTEYSQKSWSPKDTLAIYGPLKFSRMSMITDTLSHLMGVCAVKDDIEGAILSDAIKHYTQKYGKATVTNDDFFGTFYIHTWETGNAIMKLVSSEHTRGEGEMRISVTMSEKDSSVTAKQEEPKSGTQNNVYLFLIRKDAVADIVGKIHSGDFLFCK